MRTVWIIKQMNPVFSHSTAYCAFKHEQWDGSCSRNRQFLGLTTTWDKNLRSMCLCESIVACRPRINELLDSNCPREAWVAFLDQKKIGFSRDWFQWKSRHNPEKDVIRNQRRRSFVEETECRDDPRNKKNILKNGAPNPNQWWKLE